ncbi:MAG: hypothetical protein JWN71_3307, partial [Xanthobacteraceae bacterium]|nr:hypothetical protein [Xanthobacteraceae bacterium]
MSILRPDVSQRLREAVRFLPLTL